MNGDLSLYGSPSLGSIYCDAAYTGAIEGAELGIQIGGAYFICEAIYQLACHIFTHTRMDLAGMCQRACTITAATIAGKSLCEVAVTANQVNEYYERSSHS